MSDKTLFDFIKDNWRIWETNDEFATAHKISPQRLYNWLKSQHTTDGERVFSSVTGKPMRADGVEFKIRGYESCKSKGCQTTNSK